MSARRSRFKVAASIPVRRKPPAQNDSNVESTLIAEKNEDPNLDFKIKGRVDNPVTKQDPESLKRTSNLENAPVNKTLNNCDEFSSTTPSEPISSPLKKEQNYSFVEPAKCVPTLVSPPPTSPFANNASKTPIRSRLLRPTLAARKSGGQVSSTSESEDDGHRSKTQLLQQSVSICDKEVTAASKAPSTLSENECARLAFLPKKKAKVSNFVRKVVEAKRDFRQKYAHKKPDRSNLKMFDLIFYNPSNSPLRKSTNITSVDDRNVSSTMLQEEDVDDPDEITEENEGDEPVPQVKIGANGEIIIDEKSVVIESTASKKSRLALEGVVPMFEQKNQRPSYFKKRQKSSLKEWSPIETKIFYKALNCLGTDFALMHSIFPERTRTQLKNKFKREERNHGALISRTLSKPGNFDMSQLLKEVDDERRRVKEIRDRQLETDEKERIQKLNARRESANHLKCIKMLEEFVGTDNDNDPTDQNVRRSRRERRKRSIPDDYISSHEDLEHLDETSQISISCGHPNNHSAIPTEEIKPEDTETSETNAKRKNVIFRVTANRKLNASNIELADEPVSQHSSEENIDIPKQDFVQMLHDNIKSCGSVRIEFPPTGSTDYVRVVVGSGSKSSTLNVATDNLVKDTEYAEENYTINEELSKSIMADHDYISNSNTTETICTLKPFTGTETHPPLEPGYLQDDFYQNKDSSNVQNNYYSMEDPESDTGQVDIGSKEHLAPSFFETEDSTNYDEDHAYKCSASGSSGEIGLKDRTEYSALTSQALNVTYRTTGGINYAVIEAGSTPEEKKTYLAGLQPGTFVFMNTGALDVPLEHRCKMFMIAEKVSPDGSKSFVPMPVVLPPELMHLIINEMDSDVT